jgi:hypothetical protein
MRVSASQFNWDIQSFFVQSFSFPVFIVSTSCLFTHVFSLKKKNECFFTSLTVRIYIDQLQHLQLAAQPGLWRNDMHGRSVPSVVMI